MDKFEYKIRAEEIKALIAEGEFAEAVSIADTIDWRRVKSVMMLCTISDLYKINRRFQESKDILLLAYEKHPTGRLIVYSLCELSIKMEEYVQAIEYYKEFVQIAPKDTGRYILQYRLYEAQDVSLEERIAVLEEFKKRDYREKWAYELAYLYHRIGLTTKCIEECDEMFLWFGDGRYVIKALELKALHEPLNADQQAKYDAWMRGEDTEKNLQTEEEEEDYESGVPEDTRVAGKVRHADHEESGQEVPAAPTMELPEVKTVDLGQYNTINLQMALAESMKEILNDEELPETIEEDEDMLVNRILAEAGIHDAGETAETSALAQDMESGGYDPRDTDYGEADRYEAGNAGNTAADGYEAGDSDNAAADEYEAGDTGYVMAEEAAGPAARAGLDRTAYTAEEKSEPAGDAAERLLADAQEEIQEELPKEDEDGKRSIAETLIAPLLEETAKLPEPQKVEEKIQESPVIAFPGKKTEQDPGEIQQVQESEKPAVDTDDLREVGAQPARDDTVVFDAEKILEQLKQEAQRIVAAHDADRIPGARTGVLTPLNTKPSKYDNFLSQEYDGQISLVVPEAERIEKQITGQLSIEDIMAEWEVMKKSNEQKRMEDVRQRILEHTGNLFSDFDEATKNGLLEELERAFVAAIMKETGKKSAIKEVILPEQVEEKQQSKQENSGVESRSSIKNELPEEDFPEEAAVDEVEKPAEIEEPEEDQDVTEPEPVSVQPERKAPKKTGRPAGEAPVSGEETTSGGGGASADYSQMQDRELTAEERELFGQFVHHRKSKRQLVHTLDNMSLASCTGNVLITGEEEITTLTLAKALIREMQYSDNNFSGKVAKISANVLNKKDVEETLGRLDNGALIIEKAARLRPSTVAKLTRVLEKDNRGLLLIMIDKKPNINRLLEDNEALGNNFNLRVDIEPLDNEALVAYAKQYAEEQEYSIDEFGILALHTRIADRQTSDHEVSMAEVRDLVDEAIEFANKKTPKHFMDILLAKRYDDDDMIILREKDFMHY